MTAPEPAASLWAAIERYADQNGTCAYLDCHCEPMVAARAEVRRLLALTLEAAEAYADARVARAMNVMTGQAAVAARNERETDAARAELAQMLGTDD